MVLSPPTKQEADACGARIEYIDREQSATIRRISESVKLTVRLPGQLYSDQTRLSAS